MSSPTAISSPEEQAITLISPRKYHQLFTLPATDTHGPLKVTYAVAGREYGDDIPTILFCGGMFGTRWMSISQNWLAEKEGVRLLFVDRPGFGGSTPVPIPQRIPIFLETVPALLSHLNIKHISIASHSAGTIYALNVLSHLPNLLSPSHPSITLLSPWVHQSISSVSFLSAAAKLPNSLLNQWDSLTGFIINRAGPAVESSSGVLGSFMGMFSNRGDAEEPEDVEDEERRCKETIGMGLDVKIKLERLIFKYTFAENTKGANDEARLCLKSVDGSGWDKCEDYNAFVQELKGFWEQRVKENGAKKLRVKIVFAEEDAMIGKKGRKYFEDCWTKELCGDGVEVELVELKGGDHDSVVDPSKGIMGDMLAAVKAGGAE